MGPQDSHLRVAWFDRDNYLTVRALLQDRHAWPSRFEEWLENQQADWVELERTGQHPVRVMINANTFNLWCLIHGQAHDTRSFAEFVRTRPVKI